MHEEHGTLASSIKTTRSGVAVRIGTNRLSLESGSSAFSLPQTPQSPNPAPPHPHQPSCMGLWCDTAASVFRESVPEYRGGHFFNWAALSLQGFVFQHVRRF